MNISEKIGTYQIHIYQLLILIFCLKRRFTLEICWQILGYIIEGKDKIMVTCLYGKQHPSFEALFFCYFSSTSNIFILVLVPMAPRLSWYCPTWCGQGIFLGWFLGCSPLCQDSEMEMNINFFEVDCWHESAWQF